MLLTKYLAVLLALNFIFRKEYRPGITGAKPGACPPAGVLVPSMALLCAHANYEDDNNKTF